MKRKVDKSSYLYPTKKTPVVFEGRDFKAIANLICFLYFKRKGLLGMANSVYLDQEVGWALDFIRSHIENDTDERLEQVRFFSCLLEALVIAAKNCRVFSLALQTVSENEFECIESDVLFGGPFNFLGSALEITKKIASVKKA